MSYKSILIFRALRRTPSVALPRAPRPVRSLRKIRPAFSAGRPGRRRVRAELAENPPRIFGSVPARAYRRVAGRHHKPVRLIFGRP